MPIQSKAAGRPVFSAPLRFFPSGAADSPKSTPGITLSSGRPLGSALGMTIFAGSGPGIPVSIVPIGSIKTNFETEFEACGINQTRHKVYLTVTASIRIVIPTGAKTTEVTVNMLAAESIIVGAVPEGFVGYNLSEAEMDLVP